MNAAWDKPAAGTDMLDLVPGSRVRDRHGDRGHGVVVDTWEHHGQNLARVRWDLRAPGRPLDSVRPWLGLDPGSQRVGGE